MPQCSVLGCQAAPLSKQSDSANTCHQDEKRASNFQQRLQHASWTNWNASERKHRRDSSQEVSSAEFISESYFEPFRVFDDCFQKRRTSSAACMPSTYNSRSSSESKRRCVSSHHISPPNSSRGRHSCRSCSCSRSCWHWLDISCSTQYQATPLQEC